MHLVLLRFFLVFATTAIFVVSSVVTRGVFIEKYNTNLGNTSDIFNVNRRREVESEILRSLPCINSFLDQHLRPPVAVLVPEMCDTFIAIDSFLKYFSTNTTIFLLNDPCVTQNSSLGSIVMPMETIEDIRLYDLSLCNHNSDFVIVLTDAFPDQQSFLIAANEIVRVMWESWIAQLVIVGISQNSVLLAGSISFDAEETCRPSASVLLGKCEHVWRYYEANIGRPSTNNCIVNMAFLEAHPYVIYDNTTEKLQGIEGILLEEIASSMNVSLNRKKIEWTNTTNVQEVDSRMKGPDAVDLILGGLFWHRTADIEFTVSYEMAQVVWIIPKTPNVSLRGLVTPFSRYVWYAVGGTIAIGILVKILLIRDISYLDMFAFILGISTPRRPVRVSSRIQFICWNLFGFTLAQFYLGSLADQLLNESSLQIETMKELLSTGLKLGGTEIFAEFFEEIDEEDENWGEDEVMRTIRKNFVVFEYSEYLSQLADLRDGKNASFALVAITNVSMARSKDEGFVHVMKENMGSYPLAFAMRKGFPYAADVNVRLQMLVQTGITTFWANRVALNGSYYQSTTENKFSTNTLAIEQLAPGFLLLLIGYAIGFCSMILEILAFSTKLNKTFMANGKTTEKKRQRKTK